MWKHSIFAPANPNLLHIKCCRNEIGLAHTSVKLLCHTRRGYLLVVSDKGRVSPGIGIKKIKTTSFRSADVLSGTAETFCQEDVLSGPFFATFFSGWPAQTFCQEDVLSGLYGWLGVVTSGYGWLWVGYRVLTGGFGWFLVVTSGYEWLCGGFGFFGWLWVVMSSYGWLRVVWGGYGWL